MKITAMLFTVILMAGCKGVKITSEEKYVPESKELYDTVLELDNKFFEAYNHCNLALLDSLISEDLEFYHDRGGLSTSKKDLMEGLKNNICNKVTRHVKQGSIEVYPIYNYGAVEMGWHGFRNREEPNAKMRYSKFVQVWRFRDARWKLTRVISLH